MIGFNLLPFDQSPQACRHRQQQFHGKFLRYHRSNNDHHMQHQLEVIPCNISPDKLCHRAKSKSKLACNIDKNDIQAVVMSNPGEFAQESSYLRCGGVAGDKTFRVYLDSIAYYLSFISNNFFRLLTSTLVAS